MKKGVLRWRYFILGLVALGVTTYLLRIPLARLFLAKTIRKADELGIHLVLQDLCPDSALLSVEIPKWGVKWESLPLYWRFGFSPPRFELHMSQRFPSMTVSGLALKDVKVDLTYRYPLGGKWIMQTRLGASELGATGMILREPKLVSSMDSKKIEAQLGGRIDSTEMALNVETKYETNGQGFLGLGGEFRMHYGSLDASGPFSFIDKAPSRPTASGSLTVKNSSPSAVFQQLALNWKGHFPNQWRVGPLGKAATHALHAGAPAQFDLLLMEVRPVFNKRKFALPAFSLAAQIKGTITSNRLELRLRAKASDYPWEARGRGSVLLPSFDGILQSSLPLSFSSSTRIDDLLKILPVTLEDLKGDVTLSGEVQFKGGALRANQWRLEGRGVSVRCEKIPIVNVKSRIEGTTYPVFASKPGQVLEIERIGDDLALEKTRIEFDISGNQLQIRQARGELSGGIVFVRPFSIDLNRQNFATEIGLRGIDLHQILQWFAPDRLRGDGRMSGNIPISYSEGLLTIRDARLSNQSPGKISYIDDSVSHIKKKIETLEDFNDLLRQGQQALVLKALNNFHYDLLRFTASRIPYKGLNVELHLKGRNPDLARGQLFDITLPISGNVESLLKESLVKSFLETQ